MKNLTQVLKNFFRKQKISGTIKMGLEQIVPSIFLIAILILVVPGFIRSNSKSKQLIKNLLIWSIIIISVVIVSYLIL
tara:strand:- start:1795 stop:2028 length:234 start_codon:yes stop_codon:yes gene_type:complete